MKSNKNFIGILAALVLVAGGLYGIQHINAGENCAAHTTAKAAGADAKVETANATSATTATAAGCCAAKSGTVNAEHASAGAQCTYNAKTAGAQCTTDGKAKAELMTAEAALAKLAHCGIDCRNMDVEMLSSKLAATKCDGYTQEQWATMIKSAQALDAKQAEVIYASATSEKPCVGDGCPMKKLAADLTAAQDEEKKASAN